MEVGFGDRNEVVRYTRQLRRSEAREKVREPGQDRKVATVVHTSVMRYWSPRFILVTTLALFLAPFFYDGGGVSQVSHAVSERKVSSVFSPQPEYL
jgi:hypothetical protein